MQELVLFCWMFHQHLGVLFILNYRVVIIERDFFHVSYNLEEITQEMTNNCASCHLNCSNDLAAQLALFQTDQSFLLAVSHWPGLLRQDDLLRTWGKGRLFKWVLVEHFTLFHGIFFWGNCLLVACTGDQFAGWRTGWISGVGPRCVCGQHHGGWDCWSARGFVEGSG